MPRQHTNPWTRSPRDHALTALVESLFGVMWLSWNTSTPPATLNHVLQIGSLIGLFVAFVSLFLRFRYRTASAIAEDATARRHYGIIVGIEFGLIVLGGVLLGLLGEANYISVWVAAIVGVHFFSLAPVLRDRSLYVLGGLLCSITVIAFILGLSGHSNPSFVTSTGIGCSLILCAIYNLATLPRSRHI